MFGKRATSAGLTLPEMALVIAIISILAGSAILYFDLESGAASTIDAEQGALEAVVKQGAAITGSAPNSAAVINGAETYLDGQIMGGSSAATGWSCNSGAATCTLSLAGSKTATYTVSVEGVVTLTNLTGFNGYTIGAQNRIQKS